MKLLTAAIAGLAMAYTAAGASAADITGAGASFPAPLYQKWAEAYKAKTGNGVNYQSVGSGAGVKQIQAKTVTFGASDTPLLPAVLDESGLVQWPQVIGGIVPALNVPGIQPGGLVLDGKLLAGIYGGSITKWNDKRIAALNSGVALPNLAIAPVYRSDSSGTTNHFTNYLTKVDEAFAKDIGTANTVQWPAGLGAKGNEGVANQVRQTQGAVGYVEWAYIKQNKMSYAKMVNAAGKVVEPSAAAFAAAGANADWAGTPGYGVYLGNQPGDAAWPITAPTFVLMHKQPDDPAASKLALDFFRFALEDGAKLASDLDYVPLPAKVVTLVEQSWAAVKTN